MMFSRFRRQNRKHRLESSRRSRAIGSRKHRFESLEDRYLLAAPTLAPIEDMTVFAGSPVHIPLDGFDADGDELSFSVIGGDSNLTTVIPEGNRSMRISVADYGDMEFELFERRAPRTTGRMIELAATITSRRARITSRRLLRSTSTPTARPSSIITRRAKQRTISQFSRFNAGFR